jgi:hypothetical protein
MKPMTQLLAPRVLAILAVISPAFAVGLPTRPA